MSQPDTYSRFANAIAQFCGRPKVFAFVVGIIVVWLLTGPAFHFSDTWQLIINTGTSIVTFLMVFLIQHSQNRDTIAIQLKLDELIRATEGAQNTLIDLEDLEDETLQTYRKRFEDLADAARAEFQRRGKADTGTPET
ncbi:low affinity iron permease family protein [Herbaspirillum sp. HC18]|nr:low affinity iron permease family protein [Herbaspirillum sp. HC18]